MIDPDDVLQFWFAESCESPAANAKRGDFWFSPDPDIDAYIWSTYGDGIVDAGNGHCDDWADDPLGRLALIILLDQFPRNVYRGTAEAFRYDGKALALARQGAKLHQLAGLPVPQQAFFLMPYQHTEDLELQNEGVELYTSLVANAPEVWREAAENYRNFAVMHRDIVAEFGRFPHRNAVLGRSPTPPELAYLQSGGATFGQGG
jgi:uncharacterized protein (DUF924 family)